MRNTNRARGSSFRGFYDVGRKNLNKSLFTYSELKIAMEKLTPVATSIQKGLESHPVIKSNKYFT